MNVKLMNELFNNQELSPELYQFCMDIPEYVQAKQAVETWFTTLEQILGREVFSGFEETVNTYISWESRASYLFGVHLRQELCSAMMLL